MYLLVHRMWGRIRSRDLVCDCTPPFGSGSADSIFDEAQGAMTVHIAWA